MNNKLVVVLIPFCVFLLLGTAVAAAQNSVPLQSGSVNSIDEHVDAHQALTTPATVITVTSGTDPDNSKSTTCASEPVCTLRRAIVQSRGLTAGELPVLISFDIPEDPTEGYDAALDVWELPIMSTTDPSVFRRIKGQVIIDGETQPGGRVDGPKIILIGPGTGQQDGFIVGDVAGDDAIDPQEVP